MQGDFEKGLLYTQKALDIFKKIFGEEQPNQHIAGCYYIMLQIYDLMGIKYVDQEDYSNALNVFLKELEIGRKIYDENHTDMAEIYGNIGIAYGGLEDYNNALEYFIKAKDIFESNEEYADVARVYVNIGMTYGRSGDEASGIESLIKAKSIYEKYFGFDNSFIEKVNETIQTVNPQAKQ